MHSNTPITLVSVAVVLTLSYIASGQNCACGFVDSNGHLWRESVVSTFTQNAGALAAVNADWDIATSDPELQPTGYRMQYVAENAFQFNDALGLKTSAYDNNGVIKTAEIDSKRPDILYGTFRMRAQVPAVRGAVFGFFTYKNDVQEQDIEFLNIDDDYSRTVYYTNQPGNVNGDADPNATKKVVVDGDFTDFSDHRLDWLPGQTLYYYNGAQTSRITKNVPVTPSNVILNVWSNGDPNWSQGPPTQDAIATIQNVHLYFNSSAFNPVDFDAACANAGKPAACVV